MLIKMTKMALAASLVVGAASAALAGDNVKPVHHPDLISSKAHDLATKLTARVWRNGSQAYDVVPARNGSIGIMPGLAPTLCPLLEAYPDCH